MYIKQIIIQGFKSYKDQTIIEPFSPKHNVIVGRNGSGKSNFFAAIRFVLSDDYTQMGREDRQSLLHEGAGSAVMNAYVEITFDNEDDRFPTGKSELILRRTIGLKKDEYSLDRKNATKADVMNLLESAGFSRSNPYFIVPQGRVTTLTNMKDGERLKLLKEVAGTQVYETRRSESLKIMGETDTKRAKIDDLLSHIRERLSELEEEKDELRAYQEKDREKRCLQYTIFHREQEEIAKALNEVDERRQAGLDNTDDNRDNFQRGETALDAIDEQIKALTQQLEFLKADKKQYDDERREATRRKAQVELDVNDASDGQSAAQLDRARVENDLDNVQQTIVAREQQLLSIMPAYNSLKEQESDATTRLADARREKRRFQEKQGRTIQFRNKKERDDGIRKEIDDNNVELAKRKALIMQDTEDIALAEREIARLESGIATIRAKLESRDGDLTSQSAHAQQAKDVRNSLIDQRKEMWRQESKLGTIRDNAKKELEIAERSLSNMMDQSTSRGLAAVRRIKSQLGLEGVYGTLAELFELSSDRFKTAVEVTAGNSLFHYVVDNDDTATKILDVLQKEKSGRVTFMPLNRLHPRAINIPKTSEAVEMVSKLKYDEKYEKAFQQVFGKTIICPNLQVAAQYARSHGVSAITPDGDRSDKKGALSGGYHDPRQSRLDAVKTVSKFRQEYDLQYQKYAENRREMERLEQEITRAVGEFQRLDQIRVKAEESYEPLLQDLRYKSLDLQTRRDTLEVKQRARDNVDALIRDLSIKQDSLEAELATDFKKTLSSDEERQLELITSSIPDLSKQANEIATARVELETQKSTLEVELRENLRPRLDQLRLQKHDGATTASAANLKEFRKELTVITRIVEDVETQLRTTEESLDRTSRHLSELEGSRSNSLAAQEELAQAIERHQKRLEKDMGKRAFLVEKAAECARNIRELGVLPEEAFDKYAKMTSDKAVKRLHSVKEALKKYSHVNKKAFEQYNNFTKQRETLTARRAELDTSQSSIRELIDVLDQRKDEAIERTFKQVSKEFATVFEQLVPAGKGRLIIQRKADRATRDAAEDEDSEDERRENVENYTGVGISVSFNSKHDEQQRIQQLSGGQKSLCALALVFAIQKCDPAPFYLFDEIDANLDAQYRTAVAALLEQISESGQFICTTFRPEMVLVASKCYGVSYSNKTSSIDVVSAEDALKFVEGHVGGM